jgi:hypothetical protein
MVVVDYNCKRKIQVVESNNPKEKSEEKDDPEGGCSPKEKNLKLIP